MFGGGQARGQAWKLGAVLGGPVQRRDGGGAHVNGGKEMDSTHIQVADSEVLLIERGG